MKKWLSIILAVGIGGLVLAFALAQVLPRMRTTTSGIVVDIKDPALIKRGEYVARTADCLACHTTLGGKEFAGGLPMLTPLGAVYSTNITPDMDTGIGGYSFDDFNNAIKHGVRADKSALYPAMPYPSYQIMPDEDVAAMYAYFMSAVEPVHLANLKSELPPVLNWRWPLAYWQALFSRERSFVPETDEDDYRIERIKKFHFKPMTREEAILQMNLLEHDFFAFRDEDNGGSFAVVYRRKDGGYGLIDDGQ